MEIKQFLLSFIFVVGFILSFTIYAKTLRAESIKIGGGVGLEDSIEAGLHWGFYSFGEQEKFTLGIGFQQAIREYSQLYEAYKTYDKNDISKSVAQIVGSSSFSATLLTLQYQPFKNSGFYMLGGFGYGVDLRVKQDAQSVVVVADKVELANESGDYTALAQDEEFKDALNQLSNSGSLDELLNSLLPNSQDLVSQVDTTEEINALLNDQNALEIFAQDVSSRYQEQYPNGFSLDDLPAGSSGQALVCDVAIACEAGVAYQFGLGYELLIYKGLGLDLYTKASGLFVAKPYYQAGVNLMFKY